VANLEILDGPAKERTGARKRTEERGFLRGEDVADQLGAIPEEERGLKNHSLGP